MKILRGFFKWLGLTVVFVFISCVLSASVAWFFPGLWLNETTLRLAARFAPEFGVQLHWNGPLSIDAVSTSLFGKRLKLRAQGFCVGVASMQLDGCASELDVDISMLLRFGFRITAIDKFVVRGVRMTMVEMPAQASTSAGESGEPASFELPFGLASAELGEIFIGLRRFVYRAKTQTISVSGDYTLAPKAKGLEWTAKALTRLAPTQGQTEQLRVNISAVQASRRLDSLKAIDLTADYQGSFFLPLHLKAVLEDKKLHLDLGSARSQPPVLVADIDLTANKKPLFVKQPIRADANITIPQFERLVNLLRSTSFAVPSPFNVLAGPLTLTAQYKVNETGAELPMDLVLDLKSPQQRFNAGVSGKLELPSGGGQNLALNVDFKEVVMVLPPINFERLPPIFPDRRIQREEIEAPRKPAGQEAFQYSVHFRSAKPQSILLKTTLARQPVPVDLHFTVASNRPMEGEIKLGTARLDVLRRNAQLRSAVIGFPGTDSPPRLTAELSVQYSEYTIFVHFFGTTERPDFFLTSEPPLSDGDALSVLLFGQTASELDAGESESLAGTQAAIANRAVNLASMYLLATTPIESVGYDPVSNTVSARVRLRDGTTLQMKSTGRGLAGLGLRQRLGGPWSIRTEVENLEQKQGERSASAVLEWSRRY